MTQPSRQAQPWQMPIARTVCIFWAAVLAVLLGTQLSGALAAADDAVGTVDPIAAEHQAGRDRYLAQCATCHLPVPAAVLPQETWYVLLTDPAHYGVQLNPIPQFEQQLIWNYLRTYSRPNWGSRIPAYRVEDSVYFTALHPQVSFDQPVNLRGCISCHAQADAGNFRLWTAPEEVPEAAPENLQTEVERPAAPSSSGVR